MSTNKPSIRDYYLLTKPGIIYGNVITLLGGFFLASQNDHFKISVLFFSVLGMALVIGSGCVLNNYIDRDIDCMMRRTQERPSVRGIIPLIPAMLYASILGIVGFFILWFYVNGLTAVMAFIGFLFYVVVYSLWFKRHSWMGTWVGAISGAMPPVIGYCSISNQLDVGVLIVFLILYFWQIPHFYAITIFRRDDYQNAKIPVLSVSRGVELTKKWIVATIMIFSLVSLTPFLFGYASVWYGAVSLILSIYWLFIALKGYATELPEKWAKRVFFASLVIIFILSFSMLL